MCLRTLLLTTTRSVIVLMSASLAAGATAGAKILPAFPGAEGAGAASMGGRGGRVLIVTNLDDAGPGSLRAALEETGPRTVVFAVGGTIVLESALRISNPF